MNVCKSETVIIWSELYNNFKKMSSTEQWLWFIRKRTKQEYLKTRYVLHKNKTPMLILNLKRIVFILHLADNTQVKLTVDYNNYHKKLVHT